MKSERKNNQQADLITGKLPPQAVDFEELVLGAIMLEREALHSIVNLISPDVFYNPQNVLIYESIITLYDQNQPIDILTVTQQLRAEGKLEAIGGPFYVTQLTSRIASSANIVYYSSILLQKYIARRLVKFSSEISGAAYDDQQDIFELLDIADIELSKVNEISIRGGSMAHISAASAKAIAELQIREKFAKEGRAPGITTGLHDLDKLTGGWQKNNLIIIAARPAMGKTALMLHFAKCAALSGANVCIYTLEMSDVSLANRMLLSMCEVNINNFKKGFMSQQDWSEISSAAAELNKLPINIDPNPVVSMRYIKSSSRIMKKKGKCDLILIDYLQLADMSTGEKNRNREQEVAQASRQAKIIAKELDIPVILLSQLSRKVEDRTDSRPKLSDLRESGAIEQDADIVAFIYRPEYYGFDDDSAGISLEGVGELIVAKNRDGSTEDVNFKYNKSMTKIYDYDTENSFQFSANTDFDSNGIGMEN